jgi:ribosomal protein L15
MSPGGRSSNGSGRGSRTGSGQTGGGTRSPGSTKGGKKDDTTTPGAVTDLPEVGTTEFAPGQNGTLTWNTTQAIDRRPILVYVFDGHTPAGENFDYSKLIEQEFLKDKDVVKVADDFVCEKLCIKETDFLQPVKGREPVQEWLAANMKEPAQRKAKLVVLDANGALLRSFDAKELKSAKPALVVRELKKAQKTNEEHVAAAAGPQKR